MPTTIAYGLTRIPPAHRQTFIELLHASNLGESLKQIARKPSQAKEGVERQPEEYIAAVLEATAGKAPDAVQTFLGRFLHMPPAYTGTPVGMCAMAFEANLITKLPDLYKVLIETIVHADTDDFLAVFEGSIAPENLNQLEKLTEGFVALQPLIIGGMDSQAIYEIADITILQGKPVGNPDAIPVTPPIVPKGYEDAQRVYQESKEGVTPHVWRKLHPEAQIDETDTSRIQEYTDSWGILWRGDGNRWIPEAPTPPKINFVEGAKSLHARGHAGRLRLDGDTPVWEALSEVSDETVKSALGPNAEQGTTGRVVYPSEGIENLEPVSRIPANLERYLQWESALRVGDTVRIGEAQSGPSYDEQGRRHVYLDVSHGLIPAVIHKHDKEKQRVTVELTSNVPSSVFPNHRLSDIYKKGEHIEVGALHVIPREMIRRSDGKTYYMNTISSGGSHLETHESVKYPLTVVEKTDEVIRVADAKRLLTVQRPGGLLVEAEGIEHKDFDRLAAVAKQRENNPYVYGDKTRWGVASMGAHGPFFRGFRNHETYHDFVSKMKPHEVFNAKTTRYHADKQAEVQQKMLAHFTKEESKGSELQEGGIDGPQAPAEIVAAMRRIHSKGFVMGTHKTNDGKTYQIVKSGDDRNWSAYPSAYSDGTTGARPAYKVDHRLIAHSWEESTLNEKSITRPDYANIRHPAYNKIVNGGQDMTAQDMLQAIPDAGVHDHMKLHDIHMYKARVKQPHGKGQFSEPSMEANWHLKAAKAHKAAADHIADELYAPATMEGLSGPQGHISNGSGWTRETVPIGWKGQRTGAGYSHISLHGEYQIMPRARSGVTLSFQRHADRSRVPGDPGKWRHLGDYPHENAAFARAARHHVDMEKMQESDLNTLGKKAAKESTILLPIDAAPLQEAQAPNTLSSQFSQWLIESLGADHVYVETSKGAWKVQSTLAESRQMVQGIVDLYRNLPAEADVMIESTLTDYATDEGEPITTTEAISESRQDQRRQGLKLRTTIIEANCQRRVEEMRGIGEARKPTMRVPSLDHPVYKELTTRRFPKSAALSKAHTLASYSATGAPHDTMYESDAVSNRYEIIRHEPSEQAHIVRKPDFDGSWEQRYFPKAPTADVTSHTILGGEDGHAHGIPFSDELSGPGGVHVTLFPTRDSHTADDVIRAKSHLKNTRDVTGFSTRWIRPVGETRAVESETALA